MKDRPIIFSGEMVRAILDGRKTMARRVVKPQPDLGGLKPEYRDLQFEFRRMTVLGPTHIPSEWGFCAKHDKPNCVPIYGYRCPYGQPGDRLWVRETWCEIDSEYGQCFGYRADDPGQSDKWQPSIFMPRRASRITLEITDVRVERVQEIRLLDIKAEGITDAALGNVIQEGFTVQKAFEDLWDSIYGKKPGLSWADNPWVWVISFKRIGG